jgi:hypothetical protein
MIPPVNSGRLMTNHLYYGDNLAVLRDLIASESVDLIYLDPPFNSNASYNVLFKGPSGNNSAAQIEAFDDTWHWTDAAEEAFQDVRRSGNAAAAEMLTAMRSFLGENDMMAYLAMMAVRLIELHRVFLTLTPPTKPMIAEAAGAGQHEEPSFAPVPRIQIVTIEEALKLRDRAVQLPARRDDGFKKAAREARPDGQGRLDL